MNPVRNRPVKDTATTAVGRSDSNGVKRRLIIGGVVVVTLALIVGIIILVRATSFSPLLLPARELNEDNLPYQLPPGFSIEVFAEGLGKARDLVFSPDGTLLVSDIDNGRVLALIDADRNGKAEEAKTIIDGVLNPHGLTFFEGSLFLASELEVTRYHWDENTKTATIDHKILDLPKGGAHTTRSLVFDDQGNLYISIGSRCNACREEHPWIGTVIRTNSEGANPVVYARGLRNSVFITRRPEGDQLWATEMGRDLLGDDIPPDEVNIIRESKHYGWPDCYGDRQVDTSVVAEPLGAICPDTEAPVFNVPAHNAPLGLHFIQSRLFPSDWQGDLLVSYHGSWNRSTPDGYKIVRLEVEGDQVVASHDFVTGFLEGNRTYGRPVDLVLDEGGVLFFSDDKSGRVFRVVGPGS